MAETERQKALKIARALREGFRQKGEFNHADFVKALAPRLQHLTAELFEAFVRSVGDDVDKPPLPERGKGLTQGELFDLGDEYRLGQGRRIAKRLAQIEHAEEAMTINDENVINVLEANKRMREELTRLRPFWGPRVTKEQAVKAYFAAHPEDAK